MSNLGPYELDTIHCGECSAMMAALPDNCIDLWITSPPYGEMRAYNGYTFDFEPIARQLYRVTKPGGVGVWVVADETKNGSESGESFRQALGFMASGFNLHDTMIYETDKPPLTHNRYEQCFEYMFVFSKGKPKTFNPLMVQSKKAGTKRQGITYREADNILRSQNLGGIVGSVRIKRAIWYYPSGNGGSTSDNVFTHPAIFPEALARDHIISWSNPGDTVLDCFMGSGTTAKMAKETSRHFIGFDVSQEYVDLARRRIAGARVPLFVDEPAVTVAQPEQTVMTL